MEHQNSVLASHPYFVDVELRQNIIFLAKLCSDNQNKSNLIDFLEMVKWWNVWQNGRIMQNFLIEKLLRGISAASRFDRWTDK